MALSYLVNQFPDEYIKKEDIQKPKKKEQSEAEKAEIEKKEMVDYSAQVALEANEYQTKILNDQKEKEEAKHFNGLDEEAMVQLKAQHPKDTNILAQISNKQIENNELIQTLSKAGLTDEQIQFLTSMSDSNEAPDINLLKQLDAIAGSDSTSAQDINNLVSTATTEVSENVAQAAEAVNNENNQEVELPPPEGDEHVQLKSSTREKLSIDEAI